MKERAKILELMIVGIMVAASVAIVAMADPYGADSIEVVDSQRGNLSKIGSPTAPSVAAEAGNVSELLINGSAITRTWQGYYGNVTGIVTLDDADNYTMYKWSGVTVTGEIYASNESTVSWPNVICYNLTGTGGGYTGNVTVYESYIGVPSADADGINETFDSQDHSQFSIGTRVISSDDCWSVKTYVDDQPQSTTSDFTEVIMFDNSTNRTVFAAILNSSVTGFDNAGHDFQLMVPVAGGHDTPATLDTFYFYLELT